MKKLFKVVVTVCVALAFVQCSNSKFEVAKGKVGVITSETKVKDLETLFAKDSIVKVLSEGVKGNSFMQDDDEYLIYEKGGKHLLTVVPKEQLDEESTLKSVEIFDSRYKTEGGININSTFKDVNVNSSISKVESSFTSATLFIDELNSTITIDKEELGLKQFSLQKVTLEQIPDLAKIKTFVVWFN